MKLIQLCMHIRTYYYDYLSSCLFLVLECNRNSANTNLVCLLRRETPPAHSTTTFGDKRERERERERERDNNGYLLPLLRLSVGDPF